jgi:putative membrane protein
MVLTSLFSHGATMIQPLLFLADVDPAASAVTAPHWYPTTFEGALISTAAFGGLGLVLLLLGYKLFEWITPHVHIEQELAQKNMSVAVVVAALLLGLSYIIARTISG